MSSEQAADTAAVKADEIGRTDESTVCLKLMLMLVNIPGHSAGSAT